MKCDDAIDLFLTDRQAQGRHSLTGATTASYRWALNALSAQVDNRDPRLIGRMDIKATMAQWAHPNTISLARTAMRQFFKYLIEEDYMKTNPVDGTVAPRKRRSTPYRLTSAETQALMAACSNEREKRAIYLGICAGLRNTEMRMLTGRHFERPGYIHITRDIAKGGHERWIPVIQDLDPIVKSILSSVEADEYVIRSLRSRNPGVNTDLYCTWNHLSSSGLCRLVGEVAKRAGIRHPVKTHALRHAFADHVARHTEARVAQLLLGHQSLATTQQYLGERTLDELSDAVANVSFGYRAAKVSLALAVDRSADNSSSPSLDLSHRFGGSLVSLRRSFRPLVFGWQT